MTTPIPAPGPSTQEVHPWRTALRAAAVALIGSLVVLVAILPEVLAALEDIAVIDGVPEGLRVVLLGVSGVLTVVLAVLTRLMAIPGVIRASEKIGLGTGVEREA